MTIALLDSLANIAGWVVVGWAALRVASTLLELFDLLEKTHLDVRYLVSLAMKQERQEKTK